MNNISAWIFSHRWAIMPSALEAIIEVVDRNAEVSPIDLAKALHGEMWDRYIDESGNPVPVTRNALEAYNYPILDGTRRVSQAGRTAILPIIGPLTPRASFANSFSGGTSVQALSYDFNIAVANEEIDSIILSIDSPGGEITHISEFADMIYKAQTKKPVIAYVAGLGASAGYWLASAASEIVVADTGEVGSIGVVAGYTDRSIKEEKSGIKRYEIVSSQSPNKRPDPGTNEGRAQIQKIVDDLADVFISAVAKHRGVEPKVVLENYGRGKMFVGEDAVNKGLADRTGSLELLISEQEARQSINFSGGIMNLSELQAKHPELYKEAIDKGRSEAQAGNDEALTTAKSEGAKEERERIEAIRAINAPGHEDIIASAIVDPNATAESVSKQILEAQEAERKKMADKLNADGETLANELAGVGTSQANMETSTEKDSIVKSAVSAMNEGR